MTGRGSVRLNSHDAQGKMLGELRNLGKLPRGNDRSQVFSVVFAIPQKANSISFTFFGDASGTILLGDLKLCEIVKPNCLDAKVYPWSFVDGRYALIQDQLTPLNFSIANPQDLKMENPQLVLELPEDIRVVGGIYGMPAPENLGTKNGYVTWSVPIHPLNQPGKFHGQPNFRIGLLATSKADPTLRKVYFQCRNGQTAQARESIETFVLPPLPPAKKPRDYRWGVSFSYNDMSFDGETLDRWAELIARSSFNAISMNDSLIASHPKAKRDDVSGYWKAFHSRQIEVFIDSNRLGYAVLDLAKGLCQPVPEEAKITWLDGSRTTTGACPAWLATSPLFRERLKSFFRERLVGPNRCGDHFVYNWEPWPYQMKSCFDERCLADFAKFIGKDVKFLHDLGPKEIAAKHRDDWIRFRNRQLGDVMATISDVLRELEPEAGRNLDLMPWVAGDLTTVANPNYCGDIGKAARLISPFDYPARHYFYPDQGKGRYRFSAELPASLKNLETYRDWAKQQGPRPPRIIKLGPFDCGNSIVTPAQMRQMAFLDMIYGCQGTMLYRWNGGFDGRFHAACSRIGAELAELEPFFLQPGLQNAGSDIGIEGYPAESVLDINEGKWQPEFASAWMVKAPNRRIVSLANLQERWAAAISWRIPALPDGNYQVYDPLEHRRFTLNGNTKIPAAILRNGSCLKLWPNDVQIRIVEPWSPEMPGQETTELNQDAETFAKAKNAWNAQTR